jgi:4-hydroxyphenylpyruvate dioxygenase-like putative hemolysin
MHKLVNGKRVEIPEEEAIVIQTEWDNTQAAQLEFEALNGYKRKRQGEYPAVEEQLDMLWHAMDTGQLTKATDFYEAVKAIKDKYPRSI